MRVGGEAAAVLKGSQTMVGVLVEAVLDRQCIPEDPICSPGGGDSNAHNLYPADGLTDQAADFVAQKVLASTPKTEETAR